MRQTLLWLISMGLWWPSTLMAHPKAEVVLAAIDIRLTPEKVVDAGITVPMAEAHALDPTASPYLRARAVSALAALGDQLLPQQVLFVLREHAEAHKSSLALSL